VRHGLLRTARQRREINDQGSVAVQDVLYGSCTVLSRVQFDDGIPLRYPAIFRYAILRTSPTARESQREGRVQGAAVNARLCAGDDLDRGMSKRGLMNANLALPGYLAQCPCCLPDWLKTYSAHFFIRAGCCVPWRFMCNLLISVRKTKKAPNDIAIANIFTTSIAIILPLTASMSCSQERTGNSPSTCQAATNPKNPRTSLSSVYMSSPLFFSMPVVTRCYSTLAGIAAEPV